MYCYILAMVYMFAKVLYVYIFPGTLCHLHTHRHTYRHTHIRRVYPQRSLVTTTAHEISLPGASLHNTGGDGHPGMCTRQYKQEARFPSRHKH